MKGACTIILIAVSLLTAVPQSHAAQDTVRVGVSTQMAAGQELPTRTAEELVSYYNRETTIRFSGRVRVPAERTIAGDVAVLGGPVLLAGRIDGNVVVYNGDITLLPGSHIAGDLTVVGGVAIDSEPSAVAGILHTYASVFRYRRTEEGIEYLGSGAPRDELPRGRRLRLPRWTLGNSEIHISSRAYNRVEGLPLAIGPRITTGGSNPLRFEALLIYRTEAGFDPEDKDIGYEVRLRQYLGGHRALWLDGGLQSIIDPIERWQLTNLENSLAFFLFRRDYRDYYERKGWYGRFGWRSEGFSGSFEFRDERHRSISARSPWTILFNTDDRHQPNAAAEPGDLQSLQVKLAMDTRNDPDSPWSGWYNQVSFEQAIGGDLDGISPEFSRFFLDLRRYTRVSRSSVVGLRWVSGGRLGRELLPPQRQHVIGGVGSLPGYDQLEFDCGARSSATFGTDPSYGCQRFALFQAEYRSGLDVDFHWNHRQGPESDEFAGDIISVEFEPSIVLFYNAGAAWSTAESFVDHLTKSDNWLADVGAGLDFGGLGFYFAYPLVGSGGFNFFVRLTRRL